MSLNKSEIALEEDGTYRVVIAGQDSGYGNWLDTGGFSEGLMAFRWADLADAEAPTTRVVSLADLSR